MKISASQIWPKFIQTLLISTSLSAMGILIAFLLLPDGAFDVSKECIPGVARKWDGTCSGWTNKMARQYIAGSLLHWMAYVGISIKILLRHPIMRTDPGSAATVYLSAAFVFGCGITHLVDAYTVLNPVYQLQIDFLITNGIISTIAKYFVLWGLIRATELTVIRQRQLDKLKRK